ncbi:MBL fold metallo-hydrolase [soil metagenome]
MEIIQFYDEGLAHASYAVISGNEMAVIDPERNPSKYLEASGKHNAKIIAVIETHPHADFVSSHLEISEKTGADIYISKKYEAYFPHKTFDEGDELKIGNVLLKALNTPGHSPDSISVIITDEFKKDHAIASGDTVFVGDVGRPDLREKAGGITGKKEELAKAMFDTINNKYKILPDNLILYPAHGAGSLCGKATSKERSSTIGKEKDTNYAFQINDEAEFVHALIKDQPVVPKYFEYNVELNRKGAPYFLDSINSVPILEELSKLNEEILIVDTRVHQDYNNSHKNNSINIPDGPKFETWLGLVISPSERFYLAAESSQKLDELLKRAANIGYELNIEGAFVNDDKGDEKSSEFDLSKFKENISEYTIVDLRNYSERNERVIFNDSVFIPLNELRDKSDLIPADKPIVVHCAAGTRSAIGQSIIEKYFTVPVYDLSEDVKEF